MATTTANAGSSTYVRMKSSVAELSPSKSYVGLGVGGGSCVNIFNRADVTHCTLVSNHKLRFLFFLWISGSNTGGSSTGEAILLRFLLSTIISIKLYYPAPLFFLYSIGTDHREMWNQFNQYILPLKLHFLFTEEHISFISVVLIKPSNLKYLCLIYV